MSRRCYYPSDMKLTKSGAKQFKNTLSELFLYSIFPPIMITSGIILMDIGVNKNIVSDIITGSINVCFGLFIMIEGRIYLRRARLRKTLEEATIAGINEFIKNYKVIKQKPPRNPTSKIPNKR